MHYVGECLKAVQYQRKVHQIRAEQMLPGNYWGKRFIADTIDEISAENSLNCLINSLSARVSSDFRDIVTNSLSTGSAALRSRQDESEERSIGDSVFPSYT